MKKYVLIRTDTSFFDGHGSSDDGGSILSVEHTDKYNDLDFSQIYVGGEVFDEEEAEDWAADDGYNYQVNFESYKEITEDEFERYCKIVEDYNDLMESFVDDILI